MKTVNNQNALQTKKRDSNIELCRIISMFAILFWHGIHHGFINIPTISNLDNNILDFISWALFWHVNVFVLISGYFTIKFKWSKLFIFLATICIYVLLIDISLGVTNPITIIKSIYWFSSNWWFLVPYIILYISAPLLNLTNNLSNKDFNKIVLLFTILNVGIGFFYKNSYNPNGFNAQHFVYMYFIGMWIKRNQQVKQYSNLLLASVFILNTLIVFFLSHHLFSHEYWYGYNNPLIIVNAIIIFISFMKINISNRFINSVASSTLAVYLITDNGHYTRPLIVNVVNYICANYNPLICQLAIWFIVSICIFFCCIAIDKIVKLVFPLQKIANKSIDMFNRMQSRN